MHCLRMQAAGRQQQRRGGDTFCTPHLLIKPPLPPPCLPPASPQLLTFFEAKYRSALWQTEPGAYMRRYERANKPAAAFAADTQKYLDLREEVGLTLHTRLLVRAG